MPQFWKQFVNNPKSMSSDSLAGPPVANGNSHSTVNTSERTNGTGANTGISVRPNLYNRPNSYHSSPVAAAKNDQSKTSAMASSTEYKIFRDTFLSNKNGFSGRVFGVALSESLSVASAEVIVQSELVSFGRIPIVVAKCGAYLKANGLETSGIFRIAGNGKRVKELQYIFSSPPDYGAKFNNWDAYTVHDVASLLRRFLNNLEEPLVPLSLYEEFRTPLREKPRIIKHMAMHSVQHPNANRENSAGTANNKREESPLDVSSERPTDTHGNATDADTTVDVESENMTIDQRISSGRSDKPEPRRELSFKEVLASNDPSEVTNSCDDEKEEERRRRKLRHKKRLTRDIRAAIKSYEDLFVKLSNDTKQLTIYLLDLLSLFARQSQFNLMSGRNLAAIFQPSMLSHPEHDMDPKEYELSRFVVEFLIEYSYKLLPHLLKIANEEQKQQQLSRNQTRKVPQITTTSSSSIDRLPRSTSRKPSRTGSPVELLTKTSPSKSNPPSSSLLNMSPPAPSSMSRAMSPRKSNSQSQIPLKKASSSSLRVAPISRPHSRSIGSAQVPPDFIPSTKRRTNLFPWLPKSGILSDTGDLTGTDPEEADGYFDEENNHGADAQSPGSIQSGSLPKSNLLSIPIFHRSLSGNSTASSFKIHSTNNTNGRPLSMVMDGSLNGSNEDFAYSSTNETDEPEKGRRKKRESWLHRLTSR
ncbi:GTPase-activating protein SAC7 KNAG_0C04640 [Huiozyma naganishii CBS 8797]|uniref:Rho-GAP domain-containing protein n=1 Tax=Huiozyma naganishii (strain ATCC MYA-139 / BCRC 22969 / CBS 8797 / KCTC 17520 / NBRC 10181 / NCYC 3082 / Yp74L-3) TaxID=1071383 RepID=J7S669_HUIN7|nr:hypothetical protein KNAG_0C04640 [Kazachstania naganishii CBS 8797]CCK69566.1 hypothetical protein KNAG_0C04640 [Kazachstania naganishii CBS 8797]